MRKKSVTPEEKEYNDLKFKVIRLKRRHFKDYTIAKRCNISEEQVAEICKLDIRQSGLERDRKLLVAERLQTRIATWRRGESRKNQTKKRQKKAKEAHKEKVEYGYKIRAKHRNIIKIVNVEGSYEDSHYKVDNAYDFLKMNGVVFKYMMKVHKIPRTHLNTLLYLYSEGVFPKTAVIKYSTRISRVGVDINDLEERGLTNVWTTKKSNNVTYYVLSNKAKKIVEEHYLLLLGKKKFSIPRYNKTFKKDKATDSRKNFISFMKGINQR